MDPKELDRIDAEVARLMDKLNKCVTRAQFYTGLVVALAFFYAAVVAYMLWSLL